jgi:phospholipase/lecithinase/hemolysin
MKAGVAVLVALLTTFALPTQAGALPSDVTRLAIIGDSVATGYAVAPGTGYVDLLEAETPGDNVLPLAHDGSTVRRWLTIYGAELDQLATWQPTTVLIALGGNDWHIGRSTADYTTDLTYLVWQVRNRVPTARVILWHYYQIGVPVDTKVCDVWPCTALASTWSAYATAMRNTAIRNMTGYIDDSVKAPSGQAWSTYYGADRTHLTTQGHQQLYNSIRARLLACC